MPSFIVRIRKDVNKHAQLVGLFSADNLFNLCMHVDCFASPLDCEYAKIKGGFGIELTGLKKGEFSNGAEQYAFRSTQSGATWKSLYPAGRKWLNSFSIDAPT